MKVTTLAKRLIATVLASAMFLMSLQSAVVQAAMVGTEAVVSSEQAQYDRDQIIEMLDQQQAKETLISLGVNISDVEKRVQNMTAEELAQFNSQIDELPAGGTSIVGLVLFILLLLIVLDLLGATNIFPVIKPIDQY